MEYKNIWVICAHHNGKILPVTIELLGKAAKLAEESNQRAVAVVLGKDNAEFEKELIMCGADDVISVENLIYEHYSTEGYTAEISSLMDKYNPLAVLIPSTNNGRDLAGRLSARKELGMVAGCSDLYFKDDKKTLVWVRPTFDGKLYSSIVTNTFPQLGTVAGRVFRGNKPVERKGEVIKEKSVVTKEDIKPIILSIKENAGKEDIDLENARIVVSGGMGLQSKENLKIIEDFAKLVGGAVGYTKPIIDKGWADESKQVGITGKKVAPKIYFAIGISGALQHVRGIKDSELIIAVNNDPDAPIFKAAHYGIVGDLFEVMPLLTEEFKRIRE